MTRSKHLTDAELSSVPRAGTPQLTESAQQHLDSCSFCREQVELVRALADAVPSDGPDTACLTAEQLISLVDARSFAAVPTDLEDHITDCRACAGELEILLEAERGRGRLPTVQAHLPGVKTLIERLRALMTFELPQYSMSATRSNSDAAEVSSFATGLREYEAHRYEAAREQFMRLERDGARIAELPFYLGLCLLETGRGDEAVAALERAVRANPKLGAYRWYLAQALLSVGRGTDALKQLSWVASRQGRHREPAARLKRRLEAALAEPSDSDGE